MDEREEETERKREHRVIMESRGRQAFCSPSINCQLPNFVSLIHSFLLPHYLPPLLSFHICHKSGGSKTVGCVKMMALTFYWREIYIYYSFINTLPLHAPIQSLTQHSNTGFVFVCVFRSGKKCAIKNVRQGLNLDSDASHQPQCKVRSDSATDTHTLG